VRPKRSGKFKKFTSSGLELANFRLVAQCPNHYATACPTYHSFNPTAKPYTPRTNLIFSNVLNRSFPIYHTFIMLDLRHIIISGKSYLTINKVYGSTFIIKSKLRGLSPPANYTNRATYSRLSRPEPLLFLSSSSSVVLTRLSGLRSRPTTSQKIW
jgi:hypothetical protein